MSKQTDRIAAAKARTPEETAAIRKAERSRPESQSARFIAGPNKGRTVAEIRQQQRERQR